MAGAGGPELVVRGTLTETVEVNGRVLYLMQGLSSWGRCGPPSTCVASYQLLSRGAVDHTGSYL